VEAPYGTHVRLSFLEFALSTDCSTDAVTLWDGPNSSSPLVGTYCGNSTPPEFHSSNSSLYLEYHSQGGYGFGFLARYAVEGEHIIPPGACGGTQLLTGANGASGVLQDGWQSTVPYTPLNCVWRIDAPPGHFVQLIVDSLSTEVVGDGCKTQYLAAFDGVNESSSYPFFSHCGKMSQLGVAFVTTQSSLLVHFSNIDTFLAGFSARWQFVTTPGNVTGRHCWGVNYLPVANEMTGRILQNGLVMDMRRGLSCAWAIRGPDALSRVRSWWGGFKSQTQEVGGYCGDYVTLDDSHSIVKVCSNSAPSLSNFSTGGSLLNVRMYAVHGISFDLYWAISVSTAPTAAPNQPLPVTVGNNNDGAAGKIAAAVLVPLLIVALIGLCVYCWNKRRAAGRHLNLDEGQELDTMDTGSSPRLSSDKGKF